jgi:hypothetical protein
MFAIGSFAGLIKYMAGSKAILIADCLLLLLAFVLKPDPEPSNLIETKRNPRLKYILHISSALIIIGFLQSFNPNLPSLSNGLFYFRISTYPVIAIFIGYKLLRIPGHIPGLCNFILYYLIPVNALYGISQILYLDPLSIHLVKNMRMGIFTGMLGTYRVTGFLQGPVQLGLLCAIGASYFFAMMITSSHRRKLNMGLFSLTFVGLIVTMSRASLIGFVAFVAILFMKKLVSRKQAVVVTLVIAIILSSLSVYLKNLDLVNILMSRMASITAIAEDRSFREGRLYNWKEKIIPVLISSPFGRGNGSTGSSRDYSESAKFKYPIIQAESLYLSIGIELGWAALCLYILFCLIIFISCLSLLSQEPSSAAFFLTAIFIVFSVAAITSPNMSAFPVTWLFFLSAPLVAALSIKHKRGAGVQ